MSASRPLASGITATAYIVRVKKEEQHSILRYYKYRGGMHTYKFGCYNIIASANGKRDTDTY